MLGGLNVGVAGLILIMSAFSRGLLMSLLVVGGAVVALVGHRLGIPDLGLPAGVVSMGIGLGMAILGFFLERGR